MFFSNLKQMLRMHAAALDFDDPLVDGSRRLDLQVEYLRARLVANLKRISETLADQERNFVAFSL